MTAVVAGWNCDRAPALSLGLDYQSSYRVLKKLWHQSRLNFVANILFFIVMIGVLFSGLMISKSVLLTLGIQLAASGARRSIHFMLSDASVVLLGVHVALHWKWVVTNIGRYVLNPLRGLFQRRAVPPVLTAQPVRVEKK